jgi:hypothetical protein
MTWWRKLLHHLRHVFWCNRGQVDVWMEGEEVVVGFRCSCGMLQKANRRYRRG